MRTASCRNEDPVAQEGRRLGYESELERQNRAREYIAAECQAIEAANQAEIEVLEIANRFEFETWISEQHENQRQLRRWHKAQEAGTGLPSLVLATVLTVSALAVAMRTVDEFQIGWGGYLWALGLASGVPFSFHYVLQEFRHRHIRKFLAAAAFTTMLATALYFGVIRGDVLARVLDTGAQPVIDSYDAAPSMEGGADDLISGFRRLWGLAAVAMELLAGLAVHKYFENRSVIAFAALRRLQKHTAQTEKSLLARQTRLEELRSQGPRTRTAFWAGHGRGTDEARRRSGGPRAAVWLVAVFFFAVPGVRAADLLNIAVGLDLSASGNVLTHSGKTELEENIRTVSAVIAQLPVSTRLTVVGITSRSYSSPLILLDGRTPLDAGPFSNRLASSRKTLLTVWTKRTQGLKPTYKETDILGAAIYAGDALKRSDAERKVLVILSDGRNFTRELDLETPEKIDVPLSIKRVKEQGLLAVLAGVQTYMLGAGDHSGKRGTTYAQGLKQFWTQYVQLSGGSLEVFSTTREPGSLRSLISVPAGRTRPR